MCLDGRWYISSSIFWLSSPTCFYHAVILVLPSSDWVYLCAFTIITCSSFSSFFLENFIMSWSFKYINDWLEIIGIWNVQICMQINVHEQKYTEQEFKNTEAPHCRHKVQMWFCEEINACILAVCFMLYYLLSEFLVSWSAAIFFWITLLVSDSDIRSLQRDWV